MFNAQNFVEKLSFPRLSGSEGERKAQELIETQLKTLNIIFKKESFFYTTFFMNYLLRIYNLLIGLQIVILILLLILRLYYITIFVAIILLITSFFGREIREKIQFTFTKIGKKRNSFNYIIEFPAKEKDSNKNQNIIVFAHYDSISMNFPPIFDGVIFFFALVGGTIFSIHIIIITVFYLVKLISSVQIIQFFYGFLLCIFYSLQLFNKRHNKSNGTMDNATAVANVFYNINYFSKMQLNNTKLIFVLTGAEEMGDYGAHAFIKKYNTIISNGNSYFFIPDSIGGNKKTNIYAYAQGLPIKNYSPVITQYINDLLNNNKDLYKIKPMYIPPLIHFSTDHAPLKPYRYQFMIFLSKAPIHSKKDNINNYYPEMVDNFNIFIRDLIILMDNNKSDKKV